MFASLAYTKSVSSPFFHFMRNINCPVVSDAPIIFSASKPLSKADFLFLWIYLLSYLFYQQHLLSFSCLHHPHHQNRFFLTCIFVILFLLFCLIIILFLPRFIIIWDIRFNFGFGFRTWLPLLFCFVIIITTLLFLFYFIIRIIIFTFLCFGFIVGRTWWRSCLFFWKEISV